jgi:hypothetical protein
MFRKLFGKHLSRRTGTSGFEGAAWSNLPAGYADAPRALQSARRRSLREGRDLTSGSPFGYLR